MVTDKFGVLLTELGEILKIKLHPDKRGSCLIRFPNKIDVQIDLDSSNKAILIATEVAKLSPGKFRENILREALKANGLQQSQAGVFGFSKKQDALVLFDKLNIEELTGSKMDEFLKPFMQKATTWKEAISRSEIPSYLGTEAAFGAKKSSGGGMFGL